jgi:hypothetical protein
MFCRENAKGRREEPKNQEEIQGERMPIKIPMIVDNTYNCSVIGSCQNRRLPFERCNAEDQRPPWHVM